MRGYKLGIVTMKELLEAGVHFGHQTRRWDPHMKSYIFTERNGIHIIDLQRTIAQLKIAYNVIKEMSKNNGIVLFVGTKKQAQSAVVEEAVRCNIVDGSFDFMTKKEVIKLRREKEKLLKNIGGVKDLEVLPDMIFIIDPKKEAIAVAEAKRAKIPIVSIVDTNCNPEGIDYPVPGNDDAIRAINLFSSIISSAVIEGQNEAGKFEITDETKIISLTEEEEKAESIESKGIEEEGYISDELEKEEAFTSGEVISEEEDVKSEEETKEDIEEIKEEKEVKEGVEEIKEEKETKEDIEEIKEEKEAKEGVEEIKEEKETKEDVEEIKAGKETKEDIEEIKEVKEAKEDIEEIKEEKEAKEKVEEGKKGRKKNESDEEGKKKQVSQEKEKIEVKNEEPEDEGKGDDEVGDSLSETERENEKQEED
jgi:small subunit ribosomal protein S2